MNNNSLIQELIAERAFRTKLYHQCFISKSIVVCFILYGTYSKSGFYDFISESVPLAYLSCIFIQLMALLHDFIISKNMKIARECSYRIEKECELPKEGCPLNKPCPHDTERKLKGKHKFKIGNTSIHIIFTFAVCVISVGFTCFWGKITDWHDMGFRTIMIVSSLIIVCLSISFFYKTFNFEENESID